MKIISALAIIASVGSTLAAESSNLREREEDNRKLFGGGCRWPWYGCTSKKTIKVNFTGDKGISGKAFFTQASNDQVSGTWKVKLTDIDWTSYPGADCPGGLNWHIHEKPVPDGGGCGDTGGHIDGTLGCGGASQFQSKQCDGDPAVVGTTDPKIFADSCCSVRWPNNTPLGRQTCDMDDLVNTCETGDLSGKLGQIQFNTKTQVFEDQFSLRIDEIETLSLVVHCGAPRVACGNFD